MECRENAQRESQNRVYAVIFGYRGVLCLEKKTHNPKISRYLAALVVLLDPESRFPGRENRKGRLLATFSYSFYEAIQSLEAQVAEQRDDFMKAFHCYSCIAQLICDLIHKKESTPVF
jgi:hypothetical protein